MGARCKGNRLADGVLCLSAQKIRQGIAPPHFFDMQYAYNLVNAKTGLALICPLRVIKT